MAVCLFPYFCYATSKMNELELVNGRLRLVRVRFRETESIIDKHKLKEDGTLSTHEWYLSIVKQILTS